MTGPLIGPRIAWMYEPMATNADNPTYGKDPSITADDWLQLRKKTLERSASTPVTMPAAEFDLARKSLHKVPDIRNGTL